MTIDSQSLAEACERFVDWLDRRVVSEGRGDQLDRLEVDPAATFWLGRLASEEEVLHSALGDRAERLDPCAIGIRVRPSGDGPWSFNVRASARVWLKDPKGSAADPLGPWQRSPKVEVEFNIRVDPDDGVVSAGRSEFGDEFANLGADGLHAEVRVEVERWNDGLELVVQLVNTSPEKHAHLQDTHLYESSWIGNSTIRT
jgi:hypothetical protein